MNDRRSFSSKRRSTELGLQSACVKEDVGEPANAPSRRLAKRVYRQGLAGGPDVKRGRGGTGQCPIKKARESECTDRGWPVGPTLKEDVGEPANAPSRRLAKASV